MASTPNPVENVDRKDRSSATSALLRFGPYEIDRQTGQVRKFGIRLKLAGQPLEVLLLLVERAGQLVTREELQQRLWPQDVFVDFERSLNSAVKKLRAALSDNPDNPRYIETHPRKGYRFIGEVVEDAPSPPERVAPVIDTALPPTEGPAVAPETISPIISRTHYARWLGASVVLLLIVGAVFLAVRHRTPSTSTESAASQKPNVRSSIAILGFKNLSSPHQGDWLGTAIVQMLSTELQAGGKLRIVPDEAVARSKAHLDWKERDGYPRDTLRELHNDLASDYVVAGSYVALGDKQSGQVRLDMRLQETISGETLASVAVSGKQSELFELVGRAGREMRSKVAGTIGPEGDADWRAVLPANPDAAKLYSDALDRMRIGNNVSASELLQQCVTIVPEFALAHAALAQAWQALGYDGRAQASAQKALSLAASLPENVRLRVEGQYYESQHDWPGAILAYRHLFQDYPDDFDAGLKLAETEVSAGQSSDATSTISSLRSLETARRQDPRIDLVEGLVAARRADYKTQQELAQSAAKKAEASGSRLLWARAKMEEGWALDDQTQVDLALQAYREAQPVFEEAKDVDNAATVLDDIGIVLQEQGNLKAAQDSLQEAEKRFREIGDQNGLGSALTNLGELYHAEGDLGGAVELYREALDLFRKASRKENENSILNNLGGVLFERGDFRETRKTFESLLQSREAQGDKSRVAYAKINLAAALWVQGELDESATLLQEALRTFRDIGDRAAIASVQAAYARVLISKNDLAAARRTLAELIKTGDKTDVSAAQILLTQLELNEGHPEQVDGAALQTAIEGMHTQQRGGDEMEALAIQVQVFLAGGKLDLAQQSLARAQSLHNTTWLSNFDLTLAAAQIDAAQGKLAVSQRTVQAALAKAKKAGCGSCEIEVHSPRFRLNAGITAASTQ